MSSVNDLLKAIANRDYSQEYINEDISFVNERFDKFRKYFNAVYEHVYGSSTVSYGEAVKDAVPFEVPDDVVSHRKELKITKAEKDYEKRCVKVGIHLT